MILSKLVMYIYIYIVHCFKILIRKFVCRSVGCIFTELITQKALFPAKCEIELLNKYIILRLHHPFNCDFTTPSIATSPPLQLRLHYPFNYDFTTPSIATSLPLQLRLHYPFNCDFTTPSIATSPPLQLRLHYPFNCDVTILSTVTSLNIRLQK